MSLEYALVTSSSLPEKVKVSSNYVSVDRDQWLDLVEYSQGLVDKDDSQKFFSSSWLKELPSKKI